MYEGRMVLPAKQGILRKNVCEDAEKGITAEYVSRALQGLI